MGWLAQLFYLHNNLNKFLRYTLRAFAILISLLIVLIGAVYIYASYHKKQLTDKVMEQVSAKLNGHVEIGNIELSFFSNFPKVSILLKDVSITDTLYNIHKHPFFHAEKVYAIIGIGNALQKINPLTGIRIDNGQLYVYTDTSGYTNSYLFSPKKTTDSVSKPAPKTDIENIQLNNVRLTLDDQKKNKLYDFDIGRVSYKISNEDSIITCATRNNILIHSLAFNTQMGSYVKETSFKGDFRFSFNQSTKQLAFEDINILLKSHPFLMSGQFNFREIPTFSLKVFTKNIEYNFAKGLLTPKINTSLSLVQLSKPVDEVSADISGSLSGGEPLVKANWKISGMNVTSPFVSLTDCSLSGSYINEVVAGLPRNDPNSRLHFENLTGLYEGVPVKCTNAYIDNLVFPTLQCDVSSDFDLAKLNDLLGSNTIRLKEGKGNINITYSGPLENNSNKNTLINGKLSINDGVLVYDPRNIEAKNVSFNIVFKNSDVFVNDFKGNVLGSKIAMNGSGKNLMALIKTNPGIIFLDWNIYSPSLNLNSLGSLLKTKTKLAASSKSKLGSTARQLDEIVNYSNFKINLQAAELVYSKFKATNVKATLSLKDENWILNNVSLQHAGGQMDMTGTLTQKNNVAYTANVKVNMQQMDVNKVMYAFNNFGQSGIVADNLKGKLTMGAAVQLDINRNTEQPSDIGGYVDFSIKDGALLHYEPLKKVQSLIFKKRNFDEIYFAEIKDRIDIKGQEMTINRLEIQSTALTLFAEGLYSLKGNTDISIQVPISNLKKRDDSYIPENKGADSKAGASIFLRGRPGPDGSVAFKLDVFKKLRKKKE